MTSHMMQKHLLKIFLKDKKVNMVFIQIILIAKEVSVNVCIHGKISFLLANPYKNMLESRMCEVS